MKLWLKESEIAYQLYGIVLDGILLFQQIY
ncbi:Uncharacterised protein [Actinobacillus seminis]|uniref:Uncharacterized protein n=1 Tax=Actinobacillus seminis TaxID=722 RepID=A0A380VBB7_9PAST|nr:Uncharacterised protein [Actinobacillus seminis]